MPVNKNIPLLSLRVDTKLNSKLAKRCPLPEIRRGILHVGVLLESEYSLNPNQTPMKFRGGMRFLYPYYEEEDYDEGWVPKCLAMITPNGEVRTEYIAFCCEQESLGGDDDDGRDWVIIKKQVKYNPHTLTIYGGVQL